MTVKERLHRLVDRLPEREELTAERLLEVLAATADPVLRAHLMAPEDDEPDNDDIDGGLTEARADVAAGRVVTLDDVKREMGL